MTLTEQNVFAIIGTRGATVTEVVGGMTESMRTPGSALGLEDDVFDAIRTLQAEGAITVGGPDAPANATVVEENLHRYLTRAIRDATQLDGVLLTYTDEGFKASLFGEFGGP